jgi:hypothetical protein
VNLGELIVGDFPTRYGSMQVFPNSGQLLQNANTSAADQDGWFPNSIGQEAGRYSMKGQLPGRYYGPSWLAPNSGFVPSVAASVVTGNGADDPNASAQLDGSGSLGPISIVTPMPSVMRPRLDQQTVPAPCPSIASWVSSHPLLAVGAAVLLYLGISGGRK